MQVKVIPEPCTAGRL